MKPIVILQTNNSFETRSISMYSIMKGFSLYRSTYENLKNFSFELKNRALPVGSVEFVRHAMDLANIKEPEPFGYSEKLLPFLQRNIFIGTKKDLTKNIFVKPVKTKLFTGFVYTDILDDFNQEQFNVLQTLDDNEELLFSEVIDIHAEFRYYILNNKIIGSGRYDNGLDFYRVNEKFVKDIINTVNIDHPYCIDVGITKNGKTVLIELNDGWAIGLYKDSISSEQYYNFLRERWNKMIFK